MQRKLLSLLVLLTVAVTGAWADVIISGDCGTSGHATEVTYSLTSEGVMTISGTGAMMDFNGQNDQPWKDNRSVITSVVIESGVTTIGNYAFMGCTNLSSLSISNTVTKIGQNSFYNCARLSSVTIPGSVTIIGYQAFVNCTDLETFTVEGNSLESVENSVFQSSEKLTSLSFPSSLKSFGQDNFGWCDGMTSLTFNSNPFIGWFSTIGPSNMEVTMNLTTNEAGGANWTTFYNQNYSFVADTKTEVYKVDLTGTDLVLYRVNNRIVDANTPVVLKTTGDKIVMTKTKTASGDSNDNSLKGVSYEVTTDGTFYVLNYKVDKGVGFYKLASGQKVGIGKAYLTYSGGGAREFFGFDEATGLKAIDNGQLTIDNVVYDLQGRRVSQPTKGLYIVNGKKVFINK